jgi:hypothetical protein
MRAQAAAWHDQVDEACRLYNAALDERRSAWRMNTVHIRYLDQANQLKAIRAAGDVGVTNFSAYQDVLRRVDNTFAAFFRRLKAGQKAGSPRFRSRHRSDSLTWPSWGDCALRPNGRLYLQGVGDLKVKWHRSLPADAVIKTVSAKREAGEWYVCFSLELPEPALLPERPLAVGIDVGLESFATLSNGVSIGNPRHSRVAERALARAQRKLARRRQRSRRRQKARAELARAHQHLANQRGRRPPRWGDSRWWQEHSNQTRMGCLFLLLMMLAPRAGIIFLWAVTDYVQRSFTTAQRRATAAPDCGPVIQRRTGDLTANDLAQPASWLPPLASAEECSPTLGSATSRSTLPAPRHRRVFANSASWSSSSGVLVLKPRRRLTVSALASSDASFRQRARKP